MRVARMFATNLTKKLMSNTCNVRLKQMRLAVPSWVSHYKVYL